MRWGNTALIAKNRGIAIRRYRHKKAQLHALFKSFRKK